MNEEKAYLHRLHDVADVVNEPFNKIYNMAIALYKENKKGDLEIMQLYGLPKLKWYKEDEEIYSDTVKVLETLSKSACKAIAALITKSGVKKVNYERVNNMPFPPVLW